MPSAQLRQWLSSPRAPRWIVALAILVALPAVRLPLCLDDRWHRAALLGDARWLLHVRGPLDLFMFADGTPEEHRQIIETGFGAWWASPHLRIAFLRPVASLTHALDYALWPSSPALMHLHSIAWYAALVAIVIALYRRLLGARSGTEPWVAGLAALLYAIDVSHGLPVGWVANRNALCAATFAFGALLAHDQRRPAVTALLLVLALGCGEGAVAIFAFFLAHALFLDPRPRSDRLRAHAAPIVVAVAYVVVHHVGRYGVFGSGVYVDPAHDPLRFLGAALAHVPLLVGCELGAPTPDVYAFVPLGGKIVFLAFASIAIALAALGLVRLRASPEARFFAVGGVLAVLPACATFPSGRTMLIAGFGLVGLLARIAALPAQSRALRTYLTWAVGVRLVVSPFLMIFTEHGMNLVDRNVERLAEGIPNDPSVRGKRLVLVTTADSAFSYYVVVNRLERDEPVPRQMLVLAGGNRDVVVTREGDRTLRVKTAEGFYRRGTDLFFRSFDEPMPAGTRVAQSDVAITITHALPDGVPDEARFDFDRPLEDERWLFVAWDGRTLRPFALPRIGETRAMPGRPPPMF